MYQIQFFLQRNLKAYFFCFAFNELYLTDMEAALRNMDFSNTNYLKTEDQENNFLLEYVCEQF